jgi:hypothetical protein
VRRRVLLVLSLSGLALLLVGAVGATGRTITVGPSVDVTKLRGDDAEATIAINPHNPQQLWTAVNRFTARLSSNGGTTWKKAGGGVPKHGICCDNASAWDHFGNLFLATLNLKKGNVDKVLLYYSTNGGKSFKQPKKMKQLNTSPNIDQPTVKVGDDMVWTTWNEDETIVARGAPVTGLGKIGTFNARQAVPGSHVAFASTKRRLPGADLREPAPGSGNGVGQFGDIAIAPGGQVTVVYQDDGVLNDGTCPCHIFANTDPDGLGAQGFGPQVQAATTNVNKFDPIDPQPNRTIDAEANIQYDRSGGPHNGRLYLAYTDSPLPMSSNTDIYVRTSDNFGATWSAPVKVNDDVTTTSQFLPYISVDQTTGNVIVTWYDDRNDPVNNTHVEYWGAVSTDGGATFSPNFQISAGTSDSQTVQDPGFEFGDYSWVDFFGGVAHAVWSDNSNSTGDNPDGTGSGLDLYTAAITVS